MSLNGVIAPEVQVLIVVPRGADDIQIAVVVHVRCQCPKMALFAPVGDVFRETPFTVVFKNLQLELALGAFVLAGNNVEVTVAIDLNAPAEAKQVRLWLPYPMSDENQDITDVTVAGNYSALAVHRGLKF